LKNSVKEESQLFVKKSIVCQIVKLKKANEELRDFNFRVPKDDLSFKRWFWVGMSLFPYSGSFRLTTVKGGINGICASIQTNQNIYIS